MRQYLPDSVNDIKYLSDAELVFVASVYFLETLRGRSNSFKAVFRYLGNTSVEKSSVRPREGRRGPEWLGSPH